MAKKFSLLTLTLTISTLAATVPNRTSAITHGERFWTIPQLVEMKTAADAEMAELIAPCAGDRDCEDEIFFQRLDSDGKYLAIDNFSNMILMVTAINPSNSTVRVMFHDQDPMLERMLGEKQYATLSELYIAWFTKPPVMYNSYYAVYGNYEEGMYHPLYAGSAEMYGEGWFPPNVEVELSINDAEVLYNLPYTIHFTMEADITNASGAHDYSDCFASPDYQEGMECRMVFSDIGGFYFLPFWPDATIPATGPDIPGPVTDSEPGNPTDEPTDDLAPSDPAADTSEPTINPDPEPEQPTDITFSQSDELGLGTATEITEPTSASEPKTPNTGAYPAEICNREINMPWWIIALILAGNALLIWWFTPNRRHSRQNPQKSPKKS